MVELPAPVRSALATPRGNIRAGIVLIVVAVGMFPLLRVLEDAMAPSVWRETLLIGGLVIVMPALVLAGFVLIFEPARLGLARSGAWALGTYVAIGLLLTATGIPGYVDPGAWYVLPSWPGYVIWLHECTLGVGLWPCPPG